MGFCSQGFCKFSNLGFGVIGLGLRVRVPGLGVRVRIVEYVSRINNYVCSVYDTMIHHSWFRIQRYRVRVKARGSRV